MSVAVTPDPPAKPRESPQAIFRRKWRAAAGNAQSTLLNPYPGLRSFNVDEAHIFRARINQIRALRTAFAGRGPADQPRHVIIVVGGSSSGKSSIVKAGLLAEIHSLQMPGEAGDWYVCECRPVQAPMQELLQGLATMMVDAIWMETKGSAEKVDEALDLIDAPEIPVDGDDIRLNAVQINAPEIPVGDDNIRANAVRRVRKLLTERLWSARHADDPSAVAPALTLFVRETLNELDAHLRPLRAGPPRLLVSLDQFEEIFRVSNESERQAIFDLLRFADQAEAQNAPELYVVASMRSEELHRCSEFAGIADIVNRSVHLVELVLREDAKLAIVEPGRLTLQGYDFPLKADANWPFEEKAVASIADAYDLASGTIEHRADALSLLQHFLRLLWDDAVGKWVSIEADDEALLISEASLSAIAGWGGLDPGQGTVVSAPGGDRNKGRHRLAGVLNSRADAVYLAAIEAWCAAAGDSSAATREMAQSVLKAAFVSLARRDDQRRVVRDWKTIPDMLACSGEAERFASSDAVKGKTDDEKIALFERHFGEPLAAALGEFELATLIEKRADAASPGVFRTDKYTVYHEAFIRNWDKYSAWTQEAGRAIETLRAILEDLNRGGQADDVVTPGKEADLSVVLGSTDDHREPVKDASAIEGTPAEVSEIQRGWASAEWAISEIQRSAKSGEQIDAVAALAAIRDARRAAIIARAARLEADARALKALAQAAEAERLLAEAARDKAESEKKALAQAAEAERRLAEAAREKAASEARAAAQAADHRLFSAQAERDQAESQKEHASKRFRQLVLATALITVVVAFAAVTWFEGRVTLQQYWVAGISSIGFETTEISTVSTRPIGQDRDLWLALNALEWGGGAFKWSEDAKIKADRDSARAKIAHRARQVLSDLVFVPDATEIFAREIAQRKSVSCLSSEKNTIDMQVTGSAKPESAPSRVRYKLEDQALYYNANDEGFRTVNNISERLDPQTVVCASNDGSALLILSRRDTQPWTFMVLTHWNRARYGQGQSRWFLQTYQGRELLSYPSAALAAANPIDVRERERDKIAYFRQGPVVGFLVPNRSSPEGPLSIGAVWTNEGYSSPALDPDPFNAVPLAPGHCSVTVNGVSQCKIEVKASTGEIILALYNKFEGKACSEDAEYCQVNLRILRDKQELLQFIYQGRPPANFELNEEYLRIQGDDGTVRRFYRSAAVAKQLASLRWQHLTCKLSGDVRGPLTRNAYATDQLRQFYFQTGLPTFFDGKDC